MKSVGPQLRCDLFSIYHHEGKELISIKDFWLACKIKDISFLEFMLFKVTPNFEQDDIYIIDNDKNIFGMEKDKIKELLKIVNN